MKSVWIPAAAAWIVFAGLPAAAHHSFAAQYDRDQGVTLEGSVTRVEWMNPHVYFYIDVTGADGAVTEWAIELGAPNPLRRRGWSRDTLEAGDTVRIEGWLAKNGDPTANASVVIGPSGDRLFAGTSNPEASEP